MSRAPEPPPHPPTSAPRRTMGHAHSIEIMTACRDAGVAHEPWLAWARETAQLVGPDEAARRAVRGAQIEPVWFITSDELDLGPEPWWRRVWHRGR